MSKDTMNQLGWEWGWERLLPGMTGEQISAGYVYPAPTRRAAEAATVSFNPGTYRILRRQVGPWENA